MALQADAKVRLVIDGIVMQTTADNLRRGSISSSLYDFWTDFELQNAASGITGLLSRVHDDYLNRDVTLQVDLY